MPAHGAGCALRLSVGRSTWQPQGSTRRATKEPQLPCQAIEQEIEGSSSVAAARSVRSVRWAYPALQSQFRIIAPVVLPAMADLARVSAERCVLLRPSKAVRN